MACSRSVISHSHENFQLSDVLSIIYSIEPGFCSNHEQVNTCGFPPLEDREASLSLLMGLDFFGGGVIPTEETVCSIISFHMSNN